MKINHSASITHNHLLVILGCSAKKMQDIIRQRHLFYRRLTRAKKDGGVRNVTDITQPLRRMLGSIKAEILDKVVYPPYLHGSLKGKSPKTNIEAHLGAAVAVKCDITKFFPSVTEEHVFCIFRRGFHFSPSVSRDLALLTTLKGKLPEGAMTSAHIANLVFFNNEPAIVKKMESRGYRYTRYVDDIAVTSRSSLSNAEKTWIIKTLRQMVVPLGFKLKEKKTEILNKSKRKIITGLEVGGKARITRERMREIAAEIALLEGMPISDREKILPSINGKIAHAKSISPKQGQYLAKLLAGKISTNK